jgi:hypothetical protein
MLLYLIAASSSDADMALTRFESLMRRVQTLQVEVESKHPSMSVPSSGTFTMQRPDRLAFESKWGEEDYSFVLKGSTALEKVRNERLYDEYVLNTGLSGPPSRISWAGPQAFPDMLVLGSLRRYSGPSKFTFVGNEQIDGQTTQRIRVQFDSESTKYEADAWIDGEGKLLQFDQKITATEGSDRKFLAFRNYRINQPVPAPIFDFEFPDGFRPFALPRGEVPLMIGNQAPLKGWVGSSGREEDLTPLTSKGGLLLVVADPDCAPSQAALKALEERKRELDGMGVQVAVLTHGKASMGSPFPTFYDPSGQSMNRLNPQGTPMFFLVDRKGMVAHLMQGFAPGSGPSMVAEIRQALDETATE